MLNGQRYSFTERKNDQGESITMPYLPITLSLGNRSIEIMAMRNDMSVILGHMNFLNEFHVYLYTDRSEFEVCPKP
jgi:hypothetical protein